MGTIELTGNNTLLISSHIITYGNAADSLITERIRTEIETMWNEPRGTIRYNGSRYKVWFKITAQHLPDIQPEDILGNDNPLNNYFRIEEMAYTNISFVDGLGSNTGYFQLDNLYEGSTTAAHEYGHTLGLNHPENLDIRGEGRPGIMYPRGTLVDPEFQYNPLAAIGEPGSTMHPIHRRVLQSDLDLLKANKPDVADAIVIGGFSSVWHPDHKDLA